MKNKLTLAALFMLIFLVPFILLSLSVNINIRSFDHKGFTRIVFEGDRGFEFKVDQSGTELEIKLKEKAKLQKKITSFTRSILLDRVVHQVEKNNSVLKVHLKSRFKIKRHFVLEKPFRVVFDLVKFEKEEADAEPEKVPINMNINEDKPQESIEPETEDNSVTDTKPERDSEEKPPSSKKLAAIETICIDPGHGGSDLGAVGKLKTFEKDITLKVSKKLKQLIVSRLGLRVITTREKDTEVSLNSRVSIANNQKAQIFISIHVNSSFRKAARGSETFYVSLKATDQEALLLSQKENKSFEEIDKITEDDELKMILWDMAQNEYIKESSKMASYIQDELNILLHTTNRGVKQAPFRVLMRAAMPAVLVEIAFLSNPYEEQKLRDDAFLDQVAGAIYTGVSKYIYYHNAAYGYK